MVMITNSFDKFPNEPTGLMYEQFGKIGLNPAVTSALSASDYTSSNFTTVGSTVAITSNSVVFSSTPTNADNGQYMQIDSLAESDTWSLNFKLNFSVHNTFDNVFLGFTNASSTWNTSNTYIRLQTQGGGYQRFTLGTRISGSNTESTSATNTALVNTDYWCTFSSDGSGTVTFKAWTNSGRTGTADTTLTKTYTGVGTMNYIQHRTYASGDTNVWTGTVSEITATTKPTLTSPASPKVKQHFIEWFSGKQLPSYWTNNLSGSASHGMSDEVDGGFKMTCPNSTHGGLELNFNQIKQYNLASSTVIAVMKKTDLVTTGWLNVGCTDNINIGSDASNNYSCKYHQSSSAYVIGRSGDGTTTTETTSTLGLMDTNFHSYKSESSGSQILYVMDSITEVTKTTNMPTGKGQPAMRVGMNTAHSGGSTAQIRYLEAYNT